MSEKEFPSWIPPKNLNVIESNGMVEVLVKGQRYMRWQTQDELAVRLAIVQLHQSGIGTEQDLAGIFKRHISSVKRYIDRFKIEGVSGLIPHRAGPQSRWKLTKNLRAKILMITLKEGVEELGDIQSRLKAVWNEDASLPTIRLVLTDAGLWSEPLQGLDSKIIQRELFDTKESPEQLGFKFSGDTEVKGIQTMEVTDAKNVVDLDDDLDQRSSYSTGQRIYLDCLERGGFNTYAGGLLLVPFLERHSFLPIIKYIVDLPTYEGYKLEELCQTIFFFDVFGFHSMEDFKRAYSEEFGVLVGRSQSPSLFTLRRFLHKVKTLEIGEKLIDAFALEYLKSGIAKWGTIYIDGHFLPYHGMIHITKGWHAVRQMPMKGSYHFIGVDAKFHPWLFLVRSSEEDLLEKIPEMIKKARKIADEAGLNQEDTKQLIVIFDREGHSAKLYRYLDARDNEQNHKRVIFISWAKYADKWVHAIAQEKFDQTAWVGYEIKKPEQIKYFQTERVMNKYGKIRTIVIESGTKQMRGAIYTNGTDAEIKAEKIIELMCRRWGEENLIKELMRKHTINYMPGYVFEDIQEQPMVDNPRIKALRKERAAHIQVLHKLKIQLADRMLKKGEEHADWDQTRRCEPEISQKIIGIDNQILLLNQQMDKLPAQLRYEEVHDGQKLQMLNYEKKRFLDGIKVFTYNMKEQMCQILLKYYPARKEVLSALAMIIERAGDIKLEGGKLNVRIRSFQDREINYAARHLLEELNHMQPRTLDKYRFPIHYTLQ
jgi:transposase